MKKLFILFLALGIGKLYAEDTQYHGNVWRSSQIAPDNGVYNNVLLSSSPIVFHILNGSGTVNGIGSNYFSLFWSTRNPPTTDMSTKAFIPLNQSATEVPGIGLGTVWDVPILSTGSETPVYTFYSKQGGAGPLYILYQTYKYIPSRASIQDKFWKD